MATRKYVYKNQSFRYGGDPVSTGTVELYVDWVRIISYLGSRAARNKSRTAKIGNMIKVKFIHEAEDK